MTASAGLQGKQDSELFPCILTVTLNPAVDRLIEVDCLVPGDHQVGREVSRTPGGKGINVSRVLAALGVGSIATGLLGEANRDEFADFLTGPLIEDEFVLLAGRTRQNTTIADRSTGLHTHIRDAGLPVDRPAITRLADKLRSLVSRGAIVAFSGSLPPGAGPDDFAELVGICAAAGARVAVDSSGPALAAAAAGKLWLIKPNVQELAELVGRNLETLDEQLAAARKLAARTDYVLLSRGRDGACLVTKDHALCARAEVEASAVRNTVGCGDALLGAFLASIIRHEDAATALRKAVATASASACQATSAGFEAELAARLLKGVQCREPAGVG